MVATEIMENLIQEYGIIKSFAPLPNPVLGHYCYDGKYNVILINEKIQHHERLYRTVLSEELGHYKTSVGDLTPSRLMSYHNKIMVNKKELLALKWATEFLIPTGGLLDLLQRELVTSLEELSSYYQVTEKFMLMKFEFMAKVKPVWRLEEDRYLNLYKLPSVFIMKKY